MAAREVYGISHGTLTLVKGDNPHAASIAAARQAQQAERQAVTEATGLHITDTGVQAVALPAGRCVMARCGACGLQVVRDTVQQVVAVLEQHIGAMHQQTKGVA